MHPNEPLAPERIAELRRMTLEEKLQLATKMYWDARWAKADEIRAPPGYVIVRKLEHFRKGGASKHLRDIRGMLNVSGEQIDRPALDEWIMRRGLQVEWKKVSA